MFEYQKNRFVMPSRIISASIYNKQNGISDTNGQPNIEIRVAIEIDVMQRENNALFCGPFASEQIAKEFIKTIPLNAVK